MTFFMMCNYLFKLLLNFDYLAYSQLFDIENNSLVDSIDEISKHVVMVVQSLNCVQLL